MGSTGQEPAWLNFMPFAMVLAIFYFLILLPMKKQRKKVQEFQTGLKVGDKVVTTGGIYGLITRVNDNFRAAADCRQGAASRSRGPRSAAIRARSRSSRNPGTR